MLKHKLAIAVGLMITVTGTVFAADTLDKIVNTNQQKVVDAQKSQQKINKLADTSDQLLQDYRTVNAQIDGLKIYNQQLQKQIANQQQLIGELEQSITQVSVIERQLPALMTRMLEKLQQFVALDAPFHRAERQQRIEQLNDNLQRADISNAEKFRQVLEAYKIENEYGRKIDTYEDSVEIEGQLRKVNILRVGRIALLYQTRDRKHCGLWDRNSASWKPLDNSSYQNAIVRGLRIARNQAAIELLQLPIAMTEDK
jgi:predicted RNase H-like nuclease (RuvC/YqgF family)